ncbi:restriction endonuclease [Brevundimonas sp.]|uniref:restriction endonuclease n=1 Tax=Brevundimonas sp. TaxID=1871086 RepID=UPI0028A1FD3A|nr:restriction endonuclease [Brevundimonas sp.]
MELHANSQLVQITKKTKKRFVTKKDVEEKYGNSKKMVAEVTINNPSLLDDYKRKANSRPYLPLDHDLIAATEGTAKPDWDGLLNTVLAIPTGKADAKGYEAAVESLFTALFYPDLTNPVPQSRLHNGRKIVDIDYTNMAQGGFFSWLAKHYPSGRIFVECKNYGGKVGNPEMDQLANRFSPSRGQVGLLVCRSFDDKARFHEGCRDTAKDSSRYIIALDDDDLKALVHERKTNEEFQAWTLLGQRFRALTD